MLSQILATTITINESEADGFFALFGGMFMSIMIFGLAVLIITIIGEWKLFEKAGYAGWKSLIPFYNMYILTEIAGLNGWLFLISFIPFVGVTIWEIMVGIKLAPAFGKDVAFAIGLILLPTIFYCILGFGQSKYTLGKKSEAK